MKRNGHPLKSILILMMSEEKNCFLFEIDQHCIFRVTPFRNSVPMKHKSNFDYHHLKSGMFEYVQHLNLERISLGFLIAVAYSAALGGLTTLVGTGPNIFVKGFMDQ